MKRNFEIRLIAAVQVSDRVIGKGGSLPWELPNDLKRFKELTLGHTVIMGHSTYKSIGHLLEGRENIVLSRDKLLKIPGATVVHSMTDVLNSVKTDVAYIIGGEDLYNLAWAIADVLEITWVIDNKKGDKYFPRFSMFGWRCHECKYSVDNGTHTQFARYIRISK